jgi:hypothetical protein
LLQEKYIIVDKKEHDIKTIGEKLKKNIDQESKYTSLLFKTEDNKHILVISVAIVSGVEKINSTSVPAMKAKDTYDIDLIHGLL